ncbi:carbohydrate kinase family protein, partial [Candidatus Saccharibacteria bacterium]|nr:carbohydrate kinase family protein [Candidatus Saccharibacteria bacterium]
DNAINEPGGGGLLAAILFARQGHKTHLLTKTGTDLFAQVLQNTLTDESVDVLSNTSAKHHTDTVLHLTAEGHDQTVLYYSASYLSLEKSDCDLLPVSTSWLHIATMPADKAILQYLCKIASASNQKISINPQFVHTMPAKALMKILCKCEIVVLNRDEASVLLGAYCNSTEAAKELYLQGLRHIVIYDGSEGYTVMNQDTLYVANMPKKSKPLEVSGAEEVFAAGYVAEYTLTHDIESALTHGSAQACSVLTVAGARAGILQKPLLENLKVTISNVLKETI